MSGKLYCWCNFKRNYNLVCTISPYTSFYFKLQLNRQVQTVQDCPVQTTVKSVNILNSVELMQNTYVTLKKQRTNVVSRGTTYIVKLFYPFHYPYRYIVYMSQYIYIYFENIRVHNNIDIENAIFLTPTSCRKYVIGIFIRTNNSTPETKI